MQSPIFSFEWPTLHSCLNLIIFCLLTTITHKVSSSIRLSNNHSILFTRCYLVITFLIIAQISLVFIWLFFQVQDTCLLRNFLWSLATTRCFCETLRQWCRAETAWQPANTCKQTKDRVVPFLPTIDLSCRTGSASLPNNLTCVLFKMPSKIAPTNKHPSDIVTHLPQESDCPIGKFKTGLHFKLIASFASLIPKRGKATGIRALFIGKDKIEFCAQIFATVLSISFSAPNKHLVVYKWSGGAEPKNQAPEPADGGKLKAEKESR